MPASILPFSKIEYERRLAKVRAAMEAKGLDLLFVEDPSNMAWLTSYDGWSFYVHQGVLVFLDEDPIWWGRSQDANGAIRTCWMDDDRARGYSDHFVQANDCHPMEDLAALIAEKGYANKRIGLELDNYYFSAKAYLTLQQELPNAELVDATALVNWQRGVKSDEEIIFMRRAARISEKIVDGILERVEPGVKKNELVAEIYADAVRGVDDSWGDYPGDRAAPAERFGRGGSAPHLGLDLLREGRGHLLRDRRLLSPLPRAVLPHRLSRQAAAAPARCRKGAGRGARGRARRSASGQSRRRRFARAACRTREVGHQARRRAAAIRSASPIRPTGASAPSPSGTATRRSSRPA